MKKLEHQISNEDFFASMDEIKSESKKDRMRSTSLDSAVVPVSKQSKQSIQGHTPIQKTHSSDSILRIPRSEVDLAIQAARRNLEENKKSLQKIIHQENVERKKVQKKKDLDQQRVLDALKTTGLY